VIWIAVLAGLAEAVSSAISDVNFSSNFHHHLRDPVVQPAHLSVWTAGPGQEGGY
jgi:hypothetical protein